MTNSNPYSWLSDYLNIEECKENVLRGLQSCYMLRTYKVKHIGFEKEDISKESLTFYFRTKNAPHEDFLCLKRKLSPKANNFSLNNRLGIEPEKDSPFKQMAEMTTLRNQMPKSFKNTLPIEIQRLSEYKPSFSTNILCYDEDSVEYIPIFKEEIEKRIEQANNTLDINALSIDNKRIYIDVVTNFLLKGHRTIVENTSDCQGAYKVINGIVASQYRTALNHIRENYFSDLTDTKVSLLNKIFALKEGTKSFHSKIQITHSDMERAIKNLKDTRLVDKDTPVQAFINLFKNVNMSDNKINWTGGKMALCDFIKMIIGSKYISDTNNTHWEITANCFTIHGVNIERRAFLNSKPIKDDQKLKKMDNFLITIGLQMPKKK